MAPNAHSSSHTASHALVHASLMSNGAAGARPLEPDPIRDDVSDWLVEPTSGRANSAILQLLQRAPTRPAAPVAPAPAPPPVVEANLSKRVLLTQVFTDIVGSTEILERLGDKAFCSLLLRHHNLVHEHLKAFQGRQIHAAGDGFFLVFHRPTLAVQFAVAVRDATKSLGVDLRIGIHTGECEVAHGRVEGIAVHTAARIASAAAAGEILVSSTVRDLVAGSEHRFGKRDLRILKGLTEPRQLFALEVQEGPGSPPSRG